MPVKSATLAVLMDLILPGMGHLYATSGGKGLLILIANLLALLVTYVESIFVIVNIVIWIYALVTVRRLVQAHNQFLLAARSVGRRGPVSAAFERAMPVQGVPGSGPLTGQELCLRINELVRLRLADALSFEEYHHEWNRLLATMSHRHTRQTIGEFLEPAVALVNERKIDAAMLQQVKALYEQLRRS